MFESVKSSIIVIVGLATFQAGKHIEDLQFSIGVHDVWIKVNTKTKDWVIEVELKEIENATIVQEWVRM